MKGNSAIEELLISYIAEELNAEDRVLAEQYISTDEEIRKQYEQLRNTWKLLAVNRQLGRIDINSEWKHFEQSIAGKEQRLTVVKNMDISDDEQITDKKPTGKISLRKVAVYFAVAASVLALLILGWMFTGGEKHQDKIAKTAQPAADSIKTVVRHEINTSGKQRKIILQDGSEVILYDKSEVAYKEPFVSNRRDITLKGTADFAVAKDKTRPFTVYSLNLVTTVLGTHFTVTAIEHAKNITVKLTEGKVVVKPVIHDQQGLTHEYYLLPGQKLIYSNSSNAVTVLDYNKRNQVVQQNNAATAYNDLPDLPGTKKGSWYMFNNQSLEQVFDQLSLLYHVDIVYAKIDIRNIYFIGRFNKTDSLEAVINQIAAVNNLTVTRQNNRFIIAR